MIHELKTWPIYFSRVADGSKTFEVRKDDRGYQTGDTLILREFDIDRCKGNHHSQPCRYTGCGAYTGRSMAFTVGFIFRQGFGADLGQHVVMSLVSSGVDSTTSQEETQ